MLNEFPSCCMCVKGHGGALTIPYEEDSAAQCLWSPLLIYQLAGDSLASYHPLHSCGCARDEFDLVEGCPASHKTEAIMAWHRHAKAGRQAL
jgi:hypothetical protein